MVGECGVLLAVEDFKHSGSGVALVVAAHLVDFVEQHYGVHALCLLERSRDTPGHCADIGLSVTADLGFVVNAA